MHSVHGKSISASFSQLKSWIKYSVSESGSLKCLFNGSYMQRAFKLFDKLNLYKIGKIRVTRLIFPKTHGRVMGSEVRRNDNCRTRDEYPIRRVTCHMTKITVNNGRHIITSTQTYHTQSTFFLTFCWCLQLKRF